MQNAVSIDDIIARRKLVRKRKRDVEDSDAESEVDSDGGTFENQSANDSEEASEDEKSAEDESDAAESVSSSSSDEAEETQAEKDRKAAYFDSEHVVESHSSFLAMNLSRPLLKALTTLGFHTPTPIQGATIPVALLGKDIVGNAVTGSGKTGAFIIPMLERLLYRERGKKAAATRCLILVPTRELAVQCFEVGTRLAAHTDIQFCLVVG